MSIVFEYILHFGKYRVGQWGVRIGHFQMGLMRYLINDFEME